ncbi:efflux RND transporter periplasmic adaptor subunit [Pseudomonadota bacterium]
MKIKLTRKKSTILTIIIIFIVVVAFKISMTEKFDIANFDTDKIERGSILKTVTANGTINPVNIITVGTQVSGTVEKIYVDYNDKVEKGQVLAELDTSILKRRVDEALSRLRKAKSNLEYIELNAKRTRTLYKKNYIAKVELDQSENALESAEEEYKIAKSQHETAKTNLSYAIIESPVSGVIISRNVDVGQTVAASLSAPILFEIAEDLSKMQIETSISESDIGMIKTGQIVTFDVDAFAKKTFEGSIKQIRLNPKTEQNVVTYNVIIEIDNTDLLLLPGMTAYVSVIIDEVKDVLKIKNTALRFKPGKETIAIMEIEEVPTFDIRDEALLYLFKDKKVETSVVKKGLSNISYTEIMGDNIEEGDIVISDYLNDEDGEE